MFSASQIGRFNNDGAIHLAEAIEVDCRSALEAAIDPASIEKAGIRLAGVPALRPFLSPEGSIGRIASTLLGSRARPVRAVLFNKTAANNWALAWHQDRTIVVTERLEVLGFGPYTVKDGLLHVAPPFTILESMVTLRLHFDPTPETNAPLLVAPGSHRFGRIAEADVKETVARCGTSVCIAQPGDVWAYATPILHASHAAAAPCRRRVLQIDFSSIDLPGGLTWLGV